MSQLKVNALIPYTGTTVTLGASGDTINVASGVTFNTASATVNYPAGSITNAAISSTAAIQQSKILGSPNFRNRIINGDMLIDQRNAGASVTSGLAVDRWTSYLTQASKVTLQQNAGAVTPPTGFQKYYGVTSSSSYAVLSSDLFEIYQNIEGYNVSDLGWGSADAQNVTISFWVRSSLTGTFSGSLINAPTFNRSYPFTYTINVANTWEKKSVTIEGDTSGTWGKTNGAGISVIFCIGAGSTNLTTAGAWTAGNFAGATGTTSVVGTNGATWYITGVQLEAGTSASDFEFLPIDVNLGRCQRYFYLYVNSGLDVQEPVTRFSTTGATSVLSVPVSMRATPSIYAPSSSSNYGRLILYDTSFNIVGAGVTALSLGTSPTALNLFTLVYTNDAVAGTYVYASFDTLGGATNIGLSAEL
jgi:hypothetical protein